jgi:hypothetical protein
VLAGEVKMLIHSKIKLAIEFYSTNCKLEKLELDEELKAQLG